MEPSWLHNRWCLSIQYAHHRIPGSNVCVSLPKMFISRSLYTTPDTHHILAQAVPMRHCTSDIQVPYTTLNECTRLRMVSSDYTNSNSVSSGEPNTVHSTSLFPHFLIHSPSLFYLPPPPRQLTTEDIIPQHFQFENREQTRVSSGLPLP